MGVPTFGGRENHEAVVKNARLSAPFNKTEREYGAVLMVNTSPGLNVPVYAKD